MPAQTGYERVFDELLKQKARAEKAEAELAIAKEALSRISCYDINPKTTDLAAQKRIQMAGAIAKNALKVLAGCELKEIPEVPADYAEQNK